MGKQKRNKKELAIQEVHHHQALKQKGLLKVAVALAFIVALIATYEELSMRGIFPVDEIIVRGALWIVACLLAAVAGSGSLQYTRNNKKIKEICLQKNLTKDDIGK